MKKFISMVMAAAMVVTMVPATAFAATETTLGVVKAGEKTAADAAGWATRYNEADTEIQIKLGDVETKVGEQDTFKFELEFDNAKLMGSDYEVDFLDAKLLDVSTDKYHDLDLVTMDLGNKAGDKSIVLKVTEPTVADADGNTTVIDFDAKDIIAIKAKDLYVEMVKVSEGKTATVALDGDFGTTEAKVFAAVVGKVLEAEIEDVATVAEDEVVELHEDGIEISAKVGNLPTTADNDEDLTIKFVGKGFEYVTSANVVVEDEDGNVAGTAQFEDDDEIKIDLTTAVSKVIVKGVEVYATTAKAGDVCTLKVYADDFTSATVEVAKVVDYKVVMELVDPDEDVPVFYSGVDSKNTGLTDEADHVSLDVTIYETFAGAWNMNKDFTLSLPEGVYVVDENGKGDDGVNATDDSDENTLGGDTALEEAFVRAYIKGDHEEFVFKKYTFDNTRYNDNESAKHEMTFNLTLVADPGFVGDVTLTLEGAAVDTQEVVIAKFVSPMTVKAEQNDVIIDYRYTEVPTSIVITEAEAGLWEEGLEIGFTVDDMNLIVFEEDPTFTVNEESDMEIDEDTVNGRMFFTVTEESEEEAAVVTISDIELFMQRNIPAGPYSLDMYYGVDVDVDTTETVTTVGGEEVEIPVVGTFFSTPYDEEALLGQVVFGNVAACTHSDCDDCGDVNDYSDTVHEAWINVVTAGRDQDDASFTTKVVVPVGESYIVAGDKQIALDVPAYINADGYTMLPVRAVATALGINNDAVQWNQATKTVIIMYGQRIITMTAGQSVVYVSGTAIPAASSVEIVDGRAFLGLRDLATTLGVATINWDPATKVASLN